jgi:hypothetical protein
MDVVIAGVELDVEGVEAMLLMLDEAEAPVPVALVLSQDQDLKPSFLTSLVNRKPLPVKNPRAYFLRWDVPSINT